MATSWKVQRIIAEMTQPEAAKAAGISLHRYRAIERGDIELDPSSEEYARLAVSMPFRRDCDSHERKVAKSA